MSMAMLQLDLFLSKEEAELLQIRKSHNALKGSIEKIRKGTYAEINALKKVCVELSARQEIIERNICHGK